jgi:hypothetical protein
MKVVINRCFGGFGISNQAFEKLLQRKGIAFNKVPAKYQMHGNEFDYYYVADDPDERDYISEHGFFDDRSDPDLIAVIEELGKDSWGWASDLAIIDIPDDVKWHICEYDGLEHIAEDHRTWS